MSNLEITFYELIDPLKAQISGFDFGPYLLTLKIVSFIISAFLLAGIIALLLKKFSLESAFSVFTLPQKRIGKFRSEWQMVLSRAEEDNELAWKFAVIEADKLVDKVLKNMAMPGETMGERMQSIRPGQFASLDDLWKAHKVRNSLVHEPDYRLSQPEAQNVLRRFEMFLKETGAL